MYENNYPNSYHNPDGNSLGEQNNMNNNSYATGNSSTYQYGTGGSFSQGTYYNGSGQVPAAILEKTERDIRPERVKRLL